MTAIVIPVLGPYEGMKVILVHCWYTFIHCQCGSYAWCTVYQKAVFSGINSEVESVYEIGGQAVQFWKVNQLFLIEMGVIRTLMVHGTLELKCY